MASWSEIEAEAPELAARARELLDAHVHKTLATLRKDGSPRISGTEARFFDGDLWFGSMPNAMKARDLLRDPRFAIHSGSDDPPEWKADAKVAGTAEDITDRKRAREVLKGAWGRGTGGGEDEAGEAENHGDEDDEGGGGNLFRADITELVVTGLNETRDKLVIESWHAGRGVTRVER